MKKVNKILSFTLLFLMFLLFSSFLNISQNEDAIVGKWKEESGVRTIEIYKSGNEFFGKIINNKHESEDQLTPGTVIMDNFIYDKEDQNWKGKVVIPSRDMNLNGTIILENEYQIKSVVKVAFVSKSKIWNRVK
jgi:uncharacterized protein (DUF2147 family)